jgi:hypothetical protein
LRPIAAATASLTLNEAFEYALLADDSRQRRWRTITAAPQLSMKLAGRVTFPWRRWPSSARRCCFEQQTGPVELVRLSDGLVVGRDDAGHAQLAVGLAGWAATWCGVARPEASGPGDFAFFGQHDPIERK